PSIQNSGSTATENLVENELDHQPGGFVRLQLNARREPIRIDAGISARTSFPPPIPSPDEPAHAEMEGPIPAISLTRLAVFAAAAGQDAADARDALKTYGLRERGDLVLLRSESEIPGQFQNIAGLQRSLKGLQRGQQQQPNGSDNLDQQISNML